MTQLGRRASQAPGFLAACALAALGAGLRGQQIGETDRVADAERWYEPGEHLSPLAWEHILLTGEYRWAPDPTRRPGQRRELRVER